MFCIKGLTTVAPHTMRLPAQGVSTDTSFQNSGGLQNTEREIYLEGGGVNSFGLNVKDLKVPQSSFNKTIFCVVVN